MAVSYTHLDVYKRQSQSLSVAFAQVCEKIEGSDECQYTIKEIQEMLQQISGEESVYTEKHLKTLLQEYFGDRMIVSNITGRKNVFCLSDNAYKIIDNWYKNRETDQCAERNVGLCWLQLI